MSPEKLLANYIVNFLLRSSEWKILGGVLYQIETFTKQNGLSNGLIWHTWTFSKSLHHEVFMCLVERNKLRFRNESEEKEK